MKLVLLSAVTAAVLVSPFSSSSAQNNSTSSYQYRPYSSSTNTTTTNGGTVSNGSNAYVYGQSSTFNSGSNPRNDNITNSAGVGWTFK